jgi:Domain of unknown function (DUF1992)
MDEAAEQPIIKLDRIAERRIKEAIDAGEFDNLEGMGKPLRDLEDNPFVPAEMRAAFKVLSNSGYAPDWMVLSQQIDADIERLRHAEDLHFAYLRRQLEDIAGNPYAIRRLRKETDRLKAEHRRAAAVHSQSIEEINRKISTFNQTCPIASLMRWPLAQAAEMEKFEDRVPAFLAY